MTWIDDMRAKTEEQRAKIDGILTEVGSEAADEYVSRAAREVRAMRRYSGGDDEFGLWLAIADGRCIRAIGVGIFDLADYTWRDEYEAGTGPTAAVREAIANDDTFGGLLD